MTPEKCLNCQEPIRSSLDFCPSCGQKNIGSKITISQVFSDFIDNFFNLDNRLLVSLRDLAVPGKLTKAYFMGKRTSYLNPLRLFLLCALFCFGMTRLVVSSNEVAGMSNSIFNKSSSEATIAVLDSLDSYRTDISDYYPGAKPALDSLQERMHMEFHNRTDSFEFPNDLTVFSFSTNGMKISRQDMIQMDRKDLCEKYISHYKITNKRDQFIFSQLLRSMMDISLSGFIQSLLGNLVWMMLFSLPFIAFFMKLLYIRRKRYFVEHLIFQVHGHCFLMVSIGVMLVFTYFESYIPVGLYSTILSLMSIGISVYFIWAMKAYYQQGIIRTFLKAMLLWIVYFSIMLFFLILTSILTAII